MERFAIIEHFRSLDGIRWELASELPRCRRQPTPWIRAHLLDLTHREAWILMFQLLAGPYYPKGSFDGGSKWLQGTR